VSDLLDPLADPARRAAVTAARERIEPGMTIGLGSGRAVFALVDLLATTWSSPEPLRAVAASARTEARARAAGIEPVALDGDLTLDLAVDGADEVDLRLALLKGGGGALLREKLVLAAALKSTLGVVEHGLFPDTADEVLLGHPDGSVRVLRPPGRTPVGG
jgi:ribose 5-phosphate isomerase A